MSSGKREEVVITEGFDLYVKLRRGVYSVVDRRGRRKGITCSHFTPRPRWRPAKACSFHIPTDGLTCPRCGHYDSGYAETGVRSFCANQLSPQQAKRLSEHPGRFVAGPWQRAVQTQKGVLLKVSDGRA